VFLQSLRSRTSHQHNLLEQNTASINLLSPHVTTADYAVYLSLLFGFVNGFEKIVFPLLQESITDIEERRKTHLLVSDLNRLGIDETVITAIPDHYFLEVYHSNAKALGGMYVLEGSVLGSAFIHKHLLATLGTDVISGKTTYFTVYGHETGSRWKNFLQTFSSASSGVEEDVINSASETFSILHHWFANTSFKTTLHES